MTIGFDLQRRPSPTPIDILEKARDRALSQYIVGHRLLKLRRGERETAIDETVAKLVRQQYRT